MNSSAYEVLPIGGMPTRAGDAWSVRLPVRAERIRLSKQVVARERVLIKRQQVEEVAGVDARLLREELRITRSGTMDVSQYDAATGLNQKRA